MGKLIFRRKEGKEILGTGHLKMPLRVALKIQDLKIKSSRLGTRDSGLATYEPSPSLNIYLMAGL